MLGAARLFYLFEKGGRICSAAKRPATPKVQPLLVEDRGYWFEDGLMIKIRWQKGNIDIVTFKPGSAKMTGTRDGSPGFTVTKL
jgi:hypothetical protein